MPDALFTALAAPFRHCARRWTGATTAIGFALSLSLVSGQAPGSPDSADTLARLSRYVEQYYSRAQSVIAEESVTIQPLQSDMTFDGFPRRLVYELRVEWAPSDDGGTPSATVLRQLISVGGRPPKPNDKPECHDLHAVSPEPLAILLPGRREKFTFTVAGQGRVARRAAVMVDYTPLAKMPPQISWRDECGSVDLPGHMRGRVWVDPVTSEVLRFDEHVTGAVPIPVPRTLQRRGVSAVITIERADTSIEYREVTFAEPDERLLLPFRIDSVTIARDSGVPRLRTTQTFSKYRRFLTGSRLVP